MMKKLLIITTLITAFVFISPAVSGQIKINLKSKVNREANRRANKKADEAVKAGFDKMEDGVKDVINNTGNEETQDGKGEDDAATGRTKSQAEGNNLSEISAGKENTSPSLAWNKYDFVPGDKIIFEDNLENEENGEFPSRWDFRSGNIEVARFGDENVIMFRDGAPEIIPYMKEPGKDYLPDVFTIEFDLYCGRDKFIAHLYDRKNQKSGSPTGYTELSITYNEMEFGQARSIYPDENSLKKRRWVHVAIAYTEGKLKAYMDETRLINLPRLDFEPKWLSLYIYHAKNDNLYYVKNVRIAEGGVKYYDRFLQDGKIITNGIRFDINKATIKPESMGVINEIYTLMQEHPEINFSVEGHTDSDGDNDLNLKLSENRADAVREKLVAMGVRNERLTSKGFGESMPLDTNSTAEGKANNRRVEFVKSDK